MDDKDLALILKEVEEFIKGRREDGRMADRDGRETRNFEIQLKFYRYGMQKVVPEEWKFITVKLDPEWKEYERLKKKFGQNK